MPSFELLPSSCKQGTGEESVGQGAKGSTYPNSEGPPVPPGFTPHTAPSPSENTQDIWRTRADS